MSGLWRLIGLRVGLSASFAAAALGCNSSDPLSSQIPEPPEMQFEFVAATDLDSYLDEVRTTIPTLDLVRIEFTTISDGWARETVSLYWSRQFAANLVKRAQHLRARVEAIRPASSHLNGIHLKYEEAIDAYINAFRLFIDQMDGTSLPSIEDVNRGLYQGNFLMDRFQLLLSNLAGTRVIL